MLRKECNHRDLFDGRRILSLFAMPALFFPTPALVNGVFERIKTVLTVVSMLNLSLLENETMTFGNLSKEHIRRVCQPWRRCAYIIFMSHYFSTGRAGSKNQHSKKDSYFSPLNRMQ